jgi:hypothetical protein
MTLYNMLEWKKTVSGDELASRRINHRREKGSYACHTRVKDANYRSFSTTREGYGILGGTNCALE